MYKTAGNTEIARRHGASCHCGAVEFELELPQVWWSPAVVIAPFAPAQGRDRGFSAPVWYQNSEG